MNELHSLLRRQLKRLGTQPESWQKFIETINTAYHEFDADRAMLERSLELSSCELLQANSDMRAIFEALPDLFFRISFDGIILDYKSGSETNLFLSPADLLGKSIEDIPIKIVGQRFSEALALAKKHLRKIDIEYSLTLNTEKKFHEARLLPLLKNQFIIIVRDITTRKLAQKKLQQRDNRLRKQNKILVDITKNTALIKGTLKSDFEKITESSVQALNVERVSIWLFNENCSMMTCVDLYDIKSKTHIMGATLTANQHPCFFQSLEKKRTLAISDLKNDPSTQDIWQYFAPQKITSLLIAPVRGDGRTIGAVCHEHLGFPRTWSLEEQSFAGSIADLVSLVFENRERQRARKALSESENKFRTLAETTDSAIFVFREYFLYVNPAMIQLTRYPENILLQKKITDIIHPDFKAQFAELIRLRLNNIQETVRNEIKIITAEGEERWLFISSGTISFEAQPAGLATAFDITERKAMEEQLRYQAFHDKLTGLPNRALFIDRLEHVITRYKAHSNSFFAVLFLDLDRFKVLNDSLGHLIGDQLLIEIAQRLRNALPPQDTIARLGGDEFTVLLEDITDIQAATQIAQTIQKIIGQPLIVRGHEVFTTVSIGIAFSQPHYQQPDQVLRDADIAMYRAKSNGKARYEIFSTSMHVRASKLLTLEMDLRKAIDNEEFQLYYQPIINLATNCLYGFEALIRWHHPQRGIIPPHEFVPLAEETGMIIPIGNWVLKEACQLLQQWQNSNSTFSQLKISVNVSSKQITQSDLVHIISKTVHTTGIDASYLKLEITESMMMDNLGIMNSVLNQLRRYNIQFSIDDFGTGYSSLSCLHQFPIDTLKIDRSFIQKIGEQGENAEIVATIIALAQNLKLNIIAEGIESTSQLNHLKALGCQLGQGYFFATPMMAKHLPSFSSNPANSSKSSQLYSEHEPLDPQFNPSIP